jgi:N-acyl-D-amino-acid deacylase
MNQHQTNPQLSRRCFLSAALLWPTFVRAEQPDIPSTGKAVPALAPLDTMLSTFVQQHEIPGATLAVTRQGKLVYARGFGYADVEKKAPVPPDALFRIASVSKPITAVAVLQLVEQGKFKLDAKVVDLLKLEACVPAGKKADPRWQQITVRHCLQHTGGWDRDQSYDPITIAPTIAKALDAPFPIMPPHIVRYMMGQPLDFDPGTRAVYSNLGYLVLGRIIEAQSGQPYEAYVKKNVLAPLGIKQAQLGRALVENRVAGEVRYYDRTKRMGRSIYPPRVGANLPIQYGVNNFEGYEAHGGWLASVVDLVRFARSFDEPAKAPLLKSATIQEMWARPNGNAGEDAKGKPKAAFLGCGWMVRPVAGTGKLNAWHSGYIPGSEALLVRRWDGYTWAVLFNTSDSPSGKSLVGLIDPLVHQAVDAVKEWPTTNLFEVFK